MPTTKQIVDAMLSEGAKRLEPGDTYVTPLRTRIDIHSGIAAAQGSRVVCTGKMVATRSAPFGFGEPMTLEDVRVKIGLDPFVEYLSATGCGHTMEMLCSALVALSQGQTVYLVAHTNTYAARLAWQLRPMANTCGLVVDHSNVRSVGIESARNVGLDHGIIRGMEPNTYAIFYDNSLRGRR